MRKNLLTVMFIGIIAIFAYLVLAYSPTEVSNTQVISPGPRANISGSFLLNVTAVWRNNTGGDRGNFTQVNVSFINISDSKSINITLNDSNLAVNQTFNATLLSTAFSDGIYNITINASNASDGVNVGNL